MLCNTLNSYEKSCDKQMKKHPGMKNPGAHKGGRDDGVWFFRAEIARVGSGRGSKRTREHESKQAVCVYKSISKWQFLLLFGLPLFPLMLFFSLSAFFFCLFVDWTLATTVHKRNSQKKVTPHEYLMFVLNVDDTHILIWSLSSHITSH